MKPHLAVDAHVVHNRDLENAVIKIQTNKEDKLTPAEKRAVKKFLLAPSAEEEDDEVEVSFTLPHFSY